MIRPLLLLGLVALAACGGRSSLGGAPDGGGCFIPTSFVSQSCRFSATRCRLEGIDPGGTRYELDCDGKTCLWKIDGVLACTCGKPNWANTCPNGLPMCADWLPPFNFGTLECVRE